MRCNMGIQESVLTIECITSNLFHYSTDFFSWLIHPILNGVFTLPSLFFYFNYLMSVTAGCRKRPPIAHEAKIYGRLRLIYGVLRVSKFCVFFTIPNGFNIYDIILASHFNLFQYYVRLRITDEGMVHMVHSSNKKSFFISKFNIKILYISGSHF